MTYSAVYKAFLGIHPPMPEGKEHLVYRDFPPMRLPLWEWMKSHMAQYELVHLTEAITTHEGEQYGRGQVWVHPDVFTAMKDEFEKVEHILFPPVTVEA